jgi:hypothetical protein
LTEELLISFEAMNKKQVFIGSVIQNAVKELK